MKLEGNDWFYSEKVKKHFMKPKNFLKNEKEIKDFNAYGKVGNMKCGDVMELWLKIENDKIKNVKWRTFGSLHPAEKILIQDHSYKPVNKIQKGEIIIDGSGKPNVVTKTIKKKYSGKMITFILSTSKFYNLTMTPNHPIPAIKRSDISLVNRKSQKHWPEVSPKKANNAIAQIYSASELKEHDFLLFEIPNFVKNTPELTNDFCTLLGYYVSDGNTPSKNRVIFHFGLGEKKFINEIIKICKKNNWITTTYKRNTENVICLQINEPKIVTLLNKHGGKPGKKVFSNQVMSLSPKKQMNIIDAYINGDGWITQQNKNWQPQYFISTSKIEIANQLQIMLSRNKIFAPLHYREPRQFIVRGKKYANNGEINLIFRKNTAYSRIKFSKKANAFLIPITKIIQDDYTGKIVDLSLISKPNTYRIKGISAHNCASAIASTSAMSEMIKGMSLKEALKLTGNDIMKELGGLPQIKVHCSVLGDEALREAIKDYEKK
jgi:NifU-like protein involved in Fe-S cluster formation